MNQGVIVASFLASNSEHKKRPSQRAISPPPLLACLIPVPWKITALLSTAIGNQDSVKFEHAHRTLGKALLLLTYVLLATQNVRHRICTQYEGEEEAGARDMDLKVQPRRIRVGVGARRARLRSI